MRVLRGRAATIPEDRAVVSSLVERVRESGEPAVRVWRPARQVAFGRRDAASGGYDRARERASERGYEPVEREVGGRAVAYTGTTVAFARVTPDDAERTGIADRYERATADLRRALSTLGVDAREGEPEGSFCPGTHSLSADGKVVGLAQRIRRGVAMVGGVAIPREHDEIAAVLDPVYDALGVAFDPASVGSVARAGGDGDPETVVRAVEDALVGDADPRVERVDDTGNPDGYQ